MFLLGLLSAPFSLAAEPLDKDACGRLQAEKQTLMVLGVDKQFAKGPEWAKANLAGADLANIRRFLNVEEQLKFRCGLAIVTLKVTEEPDDGDDDNAEQAGAASAPGKAAPVKPAAKPAPAQAQPAAATKSAPLKPAPKPVGKTQSWNTETTPVGSELGSQPPVAPAPVQIR